MGQRTPTETLFGIVAAFVERRTWTQAELARRLETQPATIRKRLGELVAGGFALEREEDHPHVYWSVPRNWFPGVLPFSAEEAKDLLRLLARTPKSALRYRVLGTVVARLSNLGQAGASFDPAAVRTPSVADDEEQWLALLEDAAAKKAAIKMRYFTASRRHESWRHVSVHRVDLGLRPQFLATCHAAGDLRRFRVSNVLEARFDPSVPYRRADPELIARSDAETFGGFQSRGKKVRCVFVVRDAEAAWVVRNLPDDRIVETTVPGGIRFSTETSAVGMLARFVVGLGDAARVETPELAAEVRRLARGALGDGA